MRARFAVVSGMMLALAGSAQADVLSLRAELHAGGAGGAGLGGDRKDDAFQSATRGATYGALVGVEVLFIDAWIQHHQYTDGGLLGTWTQFMAGFDVEMPLGGGARIPGAKDPDAVKPARGYLELGLGLGFGVGTDRQVDPPLDVTEVSDKGFVAEARIGAGWYLGRLASIGVAAPVSTGYYFLSDAGPANDLGTHYQAFEASLLVNLRLRFGLH